MPQRVFFSFDFDRDLQSAQQVRDAWVLHGKGEASPLHDAAEFEEATQRAGGIDNWIDDQLRGCSVFAVLVGYETYKRPWILYGIRKSVELNLGILAIDIHSVCDPHAGTDISHGLCPLEAIRSSWIYGARLSAAMNGSVEAGALMLVPSTTSRGATPGP